MKTISIFILLVSLSGCSGIIGTRENYVRMQASKINAELNGPYLNGHVDADNFLFISAPGKAKDATGAEEIYEISTDFYPVKELNK